MGRFQKSAMASVLSGALAFGAIGVGATGASAESAASTRTQPAPAGCDSLAKLLEGPGEGEVELVNGVEFLGVPNNLPTLTAAKLAYRKQRGTVSVAFADKIKQALDAKGRKIAHRRWMAVARALAKSGDPAAALVGAQLAEAVRAYSEGFRKLEKAALAYPKNLVDERDKETKRSAAVAEAERVALEQIKLTEAPRLDLQQAENKLLQWLQQLARLGPLVDRGNPESRVVASEEYNREAARRDAVEALLGENIKQARYILRVANAAATRAWDDAVSLRRDRDTKARHPNHSGRRDKHGLLTSHEAAAIRSYNSSIFGPRSKLQRKLSDFYSALTAAGAVCNPPPAVNTDGADVPSPNANTPGKTPTPAATPQPQTTTTTYYETTTTTDPYCYEHPTLGYICE